MDGCVGKYTGRHMKQQRKGKERNGWGDKEGEAGMTNVNGGRCPINPVLMTQSWSMATR